MGSETTPAPSDDARSLRLASVVLYVFDLDQSVTFYRELLALEVSATSTTAALLVNDAGFQLYVRAIGPRAPHSPGGIGVQSMIWTAPSAAELRRCERMLQSRHAHISTDSTEGFVWVEGRDPNDVPVIVTYPGPPQAIRDRIIPRVYAY